MPPLAALENLPFAAVVWVDHQHTALIPWTGELGGVLTAAWSEMGKWSDRQRARTGTVVNMWCVVRRQQKYMKSYS